MFEYATMAVEPPHIPFHLRGFSCADDSNNDTNLSPAAVASAAPHCGLRVGVPLAAIQVSQGPPTPEARALPYDSGGGTGGGAGPRPDGGGADVAAFGSGCHLLHLTSSSCTETPAGCRVSDFKAGSPQLGAPLRSPAHRVAVHAESGDTDSNDDDMNDNAVGCGGRGDNCAQVMVVAGSGTGWDLASSSSTSVIDNSIDSSSHVDGASLTPPHTDNAYDDSSSSSVHDITNRYGGLSTTSASTACAATAGVAAPGADTAGGPVRCLRVRGQRRFVPEKTRHKRQALQDMTRPLKHWLLKHRDNPYPSKAEKLELVSSSQMTLTQVSNWFANARRRLKNTVKQPDLTWASRIKLYNSCVQGNAELFSLGSDDSCLESDDDMLDHRQSDTFHDDVTDSLASSSRTATPDVVVAALGSRDVCSTTHSGSIGSSSSSSSLSSSIHPNQSPSSYQQMRHQQQQFYHHHPHQNQQQQQQQQPNSTCGPVTGSQYPGVDMDTCASFPKYKHSILHRYLSDAHHQT
ncbi:iroquois-class homeodomain protein irx-1-like isoform X3 [Pomacea canaliculata]|uniref:iroquois-class homeodomain protein irx-1-like isoform X3 n=1 Tax=Pomacea canaliculata TaxID=400727 RepID=UPI000D727226|nr:iroquois-class homeodomain protein irx-1-like isoform X3 [Pomacea canaliculata]